MVPPWNLFEKFIFKFTEKILSITGLWGFYRSFKTLLGATESFLFSGELKSKYAQRSLLVGLGISYMVQSVKPRIALCKTNAIHCSSDYSDRTDTDQLIFYQPPNCMNSCSYNSL